MNYYLHPNTRNVVVAVDARILGDAVDTDLTTVDVAASKPK